MIKIFKMDHGIYRVKVNFVDSNNLFVGYDIDAQCCESFGYFISDKPDIQAKDISLSIEEQEIDDRELVEYVFDGNFMEERCAEQDYDEIRVVVFKLIQQYGGSNMHPKYLYLYNCHNGYYSHGFEFGELKATKSGSL